MASASVLWFVMIQDRSRLDCQSTQKPERRRGGNGERRAFDMRRFLIPLLVLLVLLAPVALAVWLLGLPKIAFARPWLLTLLAVIPLVIWFSYGNLAALGEVRRWLALGLRCGILAAIILALAGVQLVHEDDTLTVFVLLDRSYSIPQELDAPIDPDTGMKSTTPPRDLRWDRLVQSMKQVTASRAHRRDRVGVIVFGRKARLEFPASDLPELNIRDLSNIPERLNTDIAGSIRLGLASFPEGTARRLLLISDGNENRGEALKEAEIARLNGVPIDVVPLRYQYQHEVTVERIDAPQESHEDRDLPLRIIVRNHSDRRVRGTLFLRRTSGAEILKAEQKVVLEPGLNPLALKWPAGTGSPGTSAFKAFFQPDNLPGDRPDNNEAWAHVLVRSDRRRILFVVPSADSLDHERLVQALASAKDPQNPTGPRSKPQVDLWTAEMVPGENSPRSQDLANYDSIILYNIPADLLNRDQQERLRKAVGDQGAGLVMIGGPDSFGAGRWQGEPLEEALPVDTSLRSLKVQAKAGLVLIMHASEMAEGNYWQKEIAKLAINKLTPDDEVGIIYYGWPGGHLWHVELQEIRANRTSILRQLETMTPGDMPQFDPALTMSRDALTKPEKQLATKHIILVSDGDHGLVQDNKLLAALRDSRITLTTVGVTTHGPAAQAALAMVSQATGGRHYPVTDPNQLPGIYIKEMRVMSQNFLYEKPFTPSVLERGDPLGEWTRAFPRLHGYVRTTKKESPLVQVLLRSTVPDPGDVNPILAQWQYRQGRVVAFTSDAGANEKSWGRDWARDEGGLYTDFWTRVVEWSMRAIDDAGLSLETRFENGKGRVTLIDNRDRETRAQKPLRGLNLTVSAPQVADSKSLQLEPISPGVYEGTFDAEASGTYALTVTETTRQDQEQRTLVRARSALTVPYSQEFASVKSNEGFLEQIAQLTGGRMFDEQALGQADVFRREGLSPVRHMQPIWHWFLFTAACAMLFDVAVRRIAIDVAAAGKKVGEFAVRLGARLRGRAVVSEDSKQYLERLKSRKTVVTEELHGKRVPARVAATRFEAKPGLEREPEPVVAAPPAPVEKPKPVPPKPQAAQPDATDFAARLMRAKQKAREQMEGEKRPPRE